LSDAKRIHLIGICGTAMATLAALLKQRGPRRARIRPEHLPADERLPRRGGHPDAERLLGGQPGAGSRSGRRGQRDLTRQPRARSVLERRLRYCSLPEAIRDFFLWGAAPVVLAGTHGKTTTTSLTGWLLDAGGLDPTVLVGGVALNFGQGGSSYRVGSGRHFVIEGDEYDSAYFDKTAKFLKYLPDVAVVNNVEFDHADIYADLDAVRLAFRRLATLVPRKRPAAPGRRQSPTRSRCSERR
jgi:UDP-N-acetylmuramate: L-alanyl-gamma-D-glutamyl-meso-diaminopimelate ligase